MIQRVLSIGVAILLAGALSAQEKATPGFNADACAKHCQEMAAQRQKMMDAGKAAAETSAAAWKEIRASVDAAKTARGEKKVAALESALDRLVEFHERMMGGMPGMKGMREAGRPGMACCGAETAGQHSLAQDGPGMAGCCGGAAECCNARLAMADCCAGAREGMPHDCPMMKAGY
jgi:hypothetical protein